jgi:NADPH:quinone reductase-like Zn-dependent oxidoreductase
MEVVFGRTRNWVEPERQGFLLSQLSRALEKRLVIPTTKTVLDWNQVQEAHSASMGGHSVGKTVLRLWCVDGRVPGRESLGLAA